MANKKYYWLKLKENFFEEKQIKYLRSLPDGDKLVIVYLKMQLKSLKTEGLIQYDKIFPNNEEELSMILDEDANIIRLTIAALLKVKAIEILEDGSFYMLAMQDLIGKDGESTERVRKFRERQEKRKEIELQQVKKLSNEQLLLPDGTCKYIDNKRYGGNAEYVYDLAECKCELCGESDGNKLLIHHNNGYSNDLEDLYLLCKKCHSNVENGNIIITRHNRRSVTCNNDVTKCNTEIDIDKDIDKDKDININKNNTKRKKFIVPTLEEINQYITEKQLKVDGQKFFEYFEEGCWKDSKGNQVKNWKQKLLTWNKYAEQTKTKKQSYEQRQYDDLSFLYANNNFK